LVGSFGVSMGGWPKMLGLLLINVSIFAIADSAEKIKRNRYHPVPWGRWIALLIGAVPLLFG
jgi:hypothetical protein